MFLCFKSFFYIILNFYVRIIQDFGNFKFEKDFEFRNISNNNVNDIVNF